MNDECILRNIRLSVVTGIKKPVFLVRKSNQESRAKAVRIMPACLIPDGGFQCHQLAPSLCKLTFGTGVTEDVEGDDRSMSEMLTRSAKTKTVPDE